MMKKSSKKTTPVKDSPKRNFAASGASTKVISLDLLELDGENPRLGANAGLYRSQTDILDAIVNTFGVDDVLSSLAVNGYFEAEPLVGVAVANGKFRIAEGNRRLAACLILIGDKRAANHARRTRQFKELQSHYKREPIGSVPVQILSDDHNLLSYLGVRHIAASQPWDSYAKAAWIAKILRESKLTLEDVSSMIGDQHRTVAKMLEGFYVVNQLRKKAYFNPSDSNRPGRGSNPAYPFSWVYTALGYGPVREWLGLDELIDDGRNEEPLTKEKLEDAGELMTFLFGNKTNGRPAAINDSRQIGELAKAIGDPQSRRLLSRGKSVADVEYLLKPAKDRVLNCLLDAQQLLTDAITPLVEGDVTSVDAQLLVSPGKKVRSLANEVNKQIFDLMQDEE